MTLKEYLEEVTKAYKNSKALVDYKSSNASIIERKRGRIISSIAEDLFAFFLADNLNFNDKKYKILIDVPLTIKMEGKSKTCYPDIVICEVVNEDEYCVKYMLDMKMDTGYFRNQIEEISNKHLEELKCMYKGITNNPKGEKQMHFILPTNKSCYYDIVIVNGTNANTQNLLTQCETVNNKYEETNMFLLSAGAHPNNGLNNTLMIGNINDLKVKTKQKNKTTLFYYETEAKRLLERIESCLN